MAFDIKEDQVGAALDAMRLFKMRGANVTMPCKNEAARLVDELSPAARIIGAVNTLSLIHISGDTEKNIFLWKQWEPSGTQRRCPESGKRKSELSGTVCRAYQK